MPEKVTESDIDSLKAAVQRLLYGTYEKNDIQILKRALTSGHIALTSGERGVAIVGEVSNSIIITGDKTTFTLTAEAQDMLNLSCETNVISQHTKLPTNSIDATAPFDVNQYLSELKKLYLEFRIKEWYVPLKGSVEVEKNGIMSVDVDQYIDQWLRDVSRKHLAILGDYGTGKSWLCFRIAMDLVDRYSNDDTNNALPLLISFKHYRPNLDLIDLIRSELFESYGIEIKKPHLLSSCLKSGKIIPILDGLDEMARELGECTALVAYSRLGISSEIPKVIITCRTNYFNSGSEERNVLDSYERSFLYSGAAKFEILHLKLMDRYRILECIKRRLDDSKADDVIRIMDSIYNLPELYSRPILLSLICKSYELFPEQKDISSPADLYEDYIDSWLLHEIREGRLIVEPEEIKHFFEDLAEHMVSENTLIIESKMLKQRLKTLLEQLGLNSHRWRNVERQIITSTFVTRSGSDSWQFAHRSFQEFFYARKFFRWERITGGSGVFSVVHTPIWQFIAQMVLERWDEKKALYWIIPRVDRINDPTLTSTTLRAAAAYWLLNKSSNTKKYPLSGIMLDSITLNNLDLSGCDLSNVDFHNSNMAGSNFSYTTFVGSRLDNASFEGANLQGANLSLCNLRYANLRGADLQGSNLFGSDISNADFRGAKFGRSQSYAWSTTVSQLEKCYGYKTALFDKEIIEGLRYL